MLQRNGDDVRVWLHIRFLRDARDGLSERAEDVPIRACLPQGIDGRLERMDKRMHVRRGKIGLLVPGRRRQHDVGIERRAGHAKIEVDEQIELALGCAAGLSDLLLFAPTYLRRACRALLLGEEAALRAEQILEEVLMSLRRRCDEVRAPDEEVARKVLRRVGIFRREVQLSLFEVFDDELLHVLEILMTRRLRLVDDLLPALVERRVERQPTETRREHVVVAGVAVARFSRRRDYLLRVNLVASPLIGAEVEE